MLLQKCAYPETRWFCSMLPKLEEIISMFDPEKYTAGGSYAADGQRASCCSSLHFSPIICLVSSVYMYIYIDIFKTKKTYMCDQLQSYEYIKYTGCLCMALPCILYCLPWPHGNCHISGRGCHGKDSAGTQAFCAVCWTCRTAMAGTAGRELCWNGPTTCGT